MSGRISLLAILTLAANVACMTSYGAPTGSVYTDVILNKEITTPARIGTREGTACAAGYLGIISGGDASIKAAAALGGITEVKAVDYRVKRTLTSVIVETCTIAHGD